jgi:hypothetical protein
MNQQEAAVHEWNRQINERCRYEILQLEEATKAVWTQKSPTLGHLSYLQIITLDPTADPLILNWRTARDTFTQAVKERTDMDDFFAKSKYIGIMENAIASLNS